MAQSVLQQYGAPGISRTFPKIITQCPKFLGTSLPVALHLFVSGAIQAGSLFFCLYMVFNYNTELYGLCHRTAQLCVVAMCIPMTQAYVISQLWDAGQTALTVLGLDFLTQGRSWLPGSVKF